MIARGVIDHHARAAAAGLPRECCVSRGECRRPDQKIKITVAAATDGQLRGKRFSADRVHLRGK